MKMWDRLSMVFALLGLLGLILVLFTFVTNQNKTISNLKQSNVNITKQLNLSKSNYNSLQSRIQGKNPDILTCSDLRNLVTQLQSNETYENTINEEAGGMAGVINTNYQLPSHCYNQ